MKTAHFFFQSRVVACWHLAISSGSVPGPAMLPKGFVVLPHWTPLQPDRQLELSAQPLELLTLQKLLCWEIKLVTNKIINRNPILKAQNFIGHFPAYSSLHCRASVSCLGGRDCVWELPGVTVPAVWPPAVSAASQVELLHAIVYPWPREYFTQSNFIFPLLKKKNHHKKPVGRKAVFSFYEDVAMISRRGSSQSICNSSVI